MEPLFEELRITEAKKIDSQNTQMEFENNCDLKIKEIRKQITEQSAQLSLEILDQSASVLTKQEIQIIYITMLQSFNKNIHSSSEHRNKDLQNIIKTIKDIKEKYPSWLLTSFFLTKINDLTFVNGYRYGFSADDLELNCYYDSKTI